MKIIFLDIDWVLITYDCFKFFDPNFWNAWNWLLETELLINLKYILEETGAHIVISSSWRRNMYEKLREEFLLAQEKLWYDFWSKVISKTPDSLWHWRGNEILTWLNNYHRTCKDWYHITHWIAIDDEDADMKSIKRLWNFVHTKTSQWLDVTAFAEAINLLNK